MWANYSTDQKNFTGHMFNINLEEQSHKMSFKALPVQNAAVKKPTGVGGKGGGVGVQCGPPPPTPRQLGLKQNI